MHQLGKTTALVAVATIWLATGCGTAANHVNTANTSSANNTVAVAKAGNMTSQQNAKPVNPNLDSASAEFTSVAGSSVSGGYTMTADKKTSKLTVAVEASHLDARHKYAFLLEDQDGSHSRTVKDVTPDKSGSGFGSNTFENIPSIPANQWVVVIKDVTAGKIVAKAPVKA